MNQQLDDTKSAQPAKPQNPLLSIWMEPRSTIRRLVELPDPDKYYLIFLWPIAINQLLVTLLIGSQQGFEFNLFTILFAIIGSVVFWLVAIPIVALLLQSGGRMLGGQANWASIRLVVAWGCFPMGVFLPCWIPLWLFYGLKLYEPLSGTAAAIQHMQTVLLIIYFVNVVLALWGIVILIGGLTEVQRYKSVWMGAVNLLMGQVVFVGLALAVAKAIDMVVKQFFLTT